jgi:hypothetical protein
METNDGKLVLIKCYIKDLVLKEASIFSNSFWFGTEVVNLDV